MCSHVTFHTDLIRPGTRSDDGRDASITYIINNMTSPLESKRYQGVDQENHKLNVRRVRLQGRDLRKSSVGSFIYHLNVLTNCFFWLKD